MKGSNEPGGDAGDRGSGLLDDLPDAVIVLTPDGRVTFWSRGAERMFGYAREEALGRLFREVVVPEEHASELEAWSRATTNEGGAVYEAVQRRKDGTTVVVDATVRAVRARDGSIQHLTIVEKDVTRLQELRKSAVLEGGMKGLLDGAPDAMVIVNREGRIVLANTQTEKLFGYPRSELVSEPIEILVPEASRARHAEYRKGYFADPRPRAMGAAIELAGRRKDGTEFPAEISLSPVPSEGGIVVCAAIRDVTERKRTHAAALSGAFATLSASEERFRQLAESVREVFWMTDVPFTKILYISPAYEQIWGRSTASLYDNPMSWMDAIHPEDRDRVRQAVPLDAWRDGELVYRISRPDGTLRWIRTRSTPVKDASGAVYRVAGIAEDITELKEAEEAVALLQAITLAASEAASTTDALRVVLGKVCAATDWVLGQAWVPSEDESVLECSPAFGGRLEGYETFRNLSLATKFRRGEGLPGRAWSASRPAWIRDLSADGNFPRGPGAATVGLKAGVAAPIVAGTRVVALIEFFSTEIRDEDARAMALVASVGNQLGTVVLRKRAEEALKRSELQLRRAQKMEAVARLAGGVAHDFNNLLTAILGYSELMLDRLDERDPLRQPLNEIRKAGNRASSLTKQLLVFSRNEVVTPRILDLNAIVTDMEKMLKRLLGEDVELRVVLDRGLGRVKADQGYMEQVVMNLCVNARDAMPHGGTLTLETSNVELVDGAHGVRRPVKAGRYVLVAISDTGTGMSADVLSHLFEPFFTTKEAGKGTGLGLSTVYGIVEGAGGYIGVYSEVGHGSSFKVYLPRVDEVLSPPTPLEPVPLRRGSETVLLVEDDELVRNLSQAILAMNGYNVLVASGGGDALLTCERERGAIDLLLTDVIMPRMSGPELVERLRTVRPKLKVLFFSGYTSGAIQSSGALAAGAAFLQKPFTPQTLAAKVRAVLDERA